MSMLADAGAQRPIFLKTENISAFGGVDSKFIMMTIPSQHIRIAF